MIHLLLGIAVVIFIVWVALVLVGHVGGLVNLLWILIVIALIWWLVSFFAGRRRAL